MPEKKANSGGRVRAFVRKPDEVRNEISPFAPIGSSLGGNLAIWSWGKDNLFPYALALMYRCSTAHRRVINDKADYISGKGFTCDEKNEKLLQVINRANGSGESLRQVLNKVAKDKALFGNAFLEVITDSKRSFISLFHQDASRCRITKDRKNVLLHHDWTNFGRTDAKELPIYPAFSEEDGIFRSIIHYKDYEPMFENYGVPSYIAGINVSAIAYKTDKWNISRLDNSFQLSGVMVLDGTVDTEEEAREVQQTAEKQFAGKPGQVMFLIKTNTDGTENTKFVPIQSNNEGDWKALHEQATSDVVVAHSWFRTLSGLDYSTGFTADRILHEYQIALNTVIQPEQEELLDPIKSAISFILGIDTTDLQIINRPPITEKPGYMKVWEARKADGLDFDENDPAQQAFISTTKI